MIKKYKLKPKEIEVMWLARDGSNHEDVISFIYSKTGEKWHNIPSTKSLGFNENAGGGSYYRGHIPYGRNAAFEGRNQINVSPNNLKDEWEKLV